MITYYISIIFLAWAISWVGTRIALPVLRRWVMDTPNARSNHKAPVPRGGGVAMIISILVCLGLLGADTSILFATLALAGVSFMDDVHDLRIGWRLLAQAFTVALAVTTLPITILPAGIPIVFAWVFIALCWIWFINLTNFMDGIDGITSLETIMVMVGICAVVAVTPSIPVIYSIYASVIAGAVLGFYWFNRSPAQLFMGDVGSITLGFLIFWLLVQLALSGAWEAALILPAYYVSDASFTLIKRICRGEKFWQAHSSHAYQQAVRKGLTHAQVVGRITLLNAFLIFLAIFATPGTVTAILMLIIAYIIAGCMIKLLIARK